MGDGMVFTRGDEGNNELDIPGIFNISRFLYYLMKGYSVSDEGNNELVEFAETCSHKKIAILG